VKITDSIFNKHFAILIVSACIVVISCHVSAEVIDPENYIQRNGYHSVRTGDDGKMQFYSFTVRANVPYITALEADIAALPKHVDVYKVCDLMRGGAKAKLIEQRGMTIDVAVINYGYSGSTIACTLKYMHKNKVGTQLIFSKEALGRMYMVFVTD